MANFHGYNYYNINYNNNYNNNYNENYDNPRGWPSPPSSPEYYSSDDSYDQSPSNSPEWQSPNNSSMSRFPPSDTSLLSSYHFQDTRADDLLDDLEEWVRQLRWLIAYGAGEQRAARNGLLEDAGLRLEMLSVQLGAAVRALEESGLGAILTRKREGGVGAW